MAFAASFSISAAIVLWLFSLPPVKISGCFQLLMLWCPADSAPSTGMAAPVMYRARPLARKSANAAHSSGSPIRFAGQSAAKKSMAAAGASPKMLVLV